MEAATAIRICKKCGANSSVVELSRWADVCKPCIADYDRRRRLNNPEVATKLKEQNKEWHRKNNARRRELHHGYYSRHRERLLTKRRLQYDPVKTKETNRRWRLLYGKRWNALQRQRYADNPAKIKAQVREYRQLYPDKVKKSIALYYRKNKPKFLASNQKRRALVRGNGVEPYSLEYIIKRDGGRCHICGKKVAKHQISRDHLIPISKGGADSPQNVALAHLQCNIRRGAGRLPAQLRLIG